MRKIGKKRCISETTYASVYTISWIRFRSRKDKVGRQQIANFSFPRPYEFRAVTIYVRSTYTDFFKSKTLLISFFFFSFFFLSLANFSELPRDFSNIETPGQNL